MQVLAGCTCGCGQALVGHTAAVSLCAGSGAEAWRGSRGAWRL